MPCTDRVNKMNLKAIHKTEVTLYLTACHYLDKNKLFWYRIFKNIKVLFVKLLWAHFKYGIVIYVPHNQRLNFLKKCDINSFGAKWPKTDFPDCGVNNRRIVAPKVSKELYWMGLQYSYKVCSKSISILRTVGLQKSGYFCVI